MKIRTISHPLGTGLASVSVAAPVIDLRPAEHVVLVIRGWGDRIRNRPVLDANPTHYLYGLESQCQRAELEVRRAHAAARSNLRSKIAGHEVVIARADEETPHVPDRSEIKDAAVADRQAWLTKLRATREQLARAKASQAALDAAMASHALLLVELDSIEDEAAEVAAMWATAYRKRAAVYTRARCGWFGRRPNETPTIPEFHSAQPLSG